MDPDFFEKHVPTFFLIVFISISTVLLTARLDKRIQSFKNFIFYLVMPVPQQLSRVIDYGEGIGHNLFALLKAHEENSALQKRIDTLTRREYVYFRLLSENERLRHLINFKELKEMPVVAAQIIGRDPLNWYQAFVINKGLADGVSQDQPVIAIQGGKSALIGRIFQASDSSANVLLLTDSLSSVAVTCRRSNNDGVVEGNNSSRLEFNYIAPEADIVIGDTIVTSGVAGIFPPGFLVGNVISISMDPEGYFQKAYVSTAIDFNNLREVLILNIKIP